jgi:hypothetical protein
VPVCKGEQSLSPRPSTVHRMTLTDDAERPWNDTNDLPLSQGDQRQRGIAELLRALADMRPARRRDDPARVTLLEAELILLLDAALIRTHQKRPRES